MSFAHVLYIPALLAVGVAVGFQLGSRKVQLEWERAQRRAREDEES